MSNLSKAGRTLLKDTCFVSALCLVKHQRSHDGTEKFLFSLDDGCFIETVVIPEDNRLTLCISTQVGCKFRCSFCASGINGLKRNLTTAEIINQYFFVSDRIAPSVITNVVFMGIGEPLENFENLIKCIDNLLSKHGVCLGKRRICVSTAGVVPGIRKLAEINPGIKLSISLHAADPKTRSKLMPINRVYPLKDVVSAAREFARRSRFPVTFEYVLIKNINAGIADAHALARLVKNINAKINLIPYNANPYFSFLAPGIEDIVRFEEILKKAGVIYTLRKSRGIDIQAACGQLCVKSKSND
jgi:23S rRNA (adenine2503-C2)-methyltransferase